MICLLRCVKHHGGAYGLQSLRHFFEKSIFFPQFGFMTAFQFFRSIKSDRFSMGSIISGTIRTLNHSGGASSYQLFISCFTKKLIFPDIKNQGTFYELLCSFGHNRIKALKLIFLFFSSDISISRLDELYDCFKKKIHFLNVGEMTLFMYLSQLYDGSDRSKKEASLVLLDVLSGNTAIRSKRFFIDCLTTVVEGCSSEGQTLFSHFLSIGLTLDQTMNLLLKFSRYSHLFNVDYLSALFIKSSQSLKGGSVFSVLTSFGISVFEVLKFMIYHLFRDPKKLMVSKSKQFSRFSVGLQDCFLSSDSFFWNQSPSEASLKYRLLAKYCTLLSMFYVGDNINEFLTEYKDFWCSSIEATLSQNEFADISLNEIVNSWLSSGNNFPDQLVFSSVDSCTELDFSFTLDSIYSEDFFTDSIFSSSYVSNSMEMSPIN